MGLASRKEVKALVRRGEITVDGKICRDSGEKYEEGQTLSFGGRKYVLKSRFYYMMNKPDGYLSSTEKRGEKTVIDLLPPQIQAQEVFPAGRLDRDSHGLLLLTNDGDFAHLVMSPKHRVDKLYFVRYEGTLAPDAEALFASGMTIDGGEICLPARLERLEGGVALITVQEGKYHQVKRMVHVCGAKVTYLKRLSIGGIRLDEALAEGEIRELTEVEISEIFTK